MKLFTAILITLSVIPLCAQMLPGVNPKDVGLSQAALDRIRPVMEKCIADNQIAGASALIARRGKVAYFETFGMMDKEASRPMSKDAIFRITAMTKPMVVVGALTLYGQGKFSMLDSVSKYLPEFTNMKVAVDKTDPVTGKRTYYTVPAERPITVLDLMRHTSGMTEQGPKDEKGELILPRLNIYAHPLAEGIQLLASAPLVFQPGTAFDYSPGPEVLGRLIEVWSGQPLDEYLEQYVFKPLHIVDTGFWVPPEKWSRLAIHYGSGPNGSIVRSEHQEINPFGIIINKRPQFLRGAGGLMSTVTDYTRFLQMLLNKGELDGVRIVSPKSIELMTSDLLGDLPILGGPIQPGYGFGLTVAVNRGPEHTATAGSAGEYYWEGGAATDFFVDPKEKMIMVFMVQKGRGIAISRQFKRLVYQTIVQKEPF
jgi:CubicO group peptidase (beta-lactamase class C family)